MSCFNKACISAAAHNPEEQARQISATAAACITYFLDVSYTRSPTPQPLSAAKYQKPHKTHIHLLVTLTSTHSLQLAKDHWLSHKGSDARGWQILRAGPAPTVRNTTATRRSECSCGHHNGNRTHHNSQLPPRRTSAPMLTPLTLPHSHSQLLEVGGAAPAALVPMRVPILLAACIAHLRLNTYRHLPVRQWRPCHAAAASCSSHIC